MRIIIWCNENQGFVSAILSAIGLLFSCIAIFVSINTARLPYKKKVRLSGTYDYLLGRETSPYGYSVVVTNIGNRPINIRSFGLGMKIKGKMQKLVAISYPDDKKGVILPGECATNRYTANDLRNANIDGNKVIYLIMSDTEGKLYQKRIGKFRELVEFAT